MLISSIIALLVAATVSLPTADSIGVLHQVQKRDKPTCYDANKQTNVGLNPVDCIAAVLSMPLTSTPGGSGDGTVVGQFGNGRPDGGPFKLPRHFASGGCMIGVSMVLPYQHSEETSSWNEVAVRANEIIPACVSRPGDRRKGGTNKAGQHKGILIEMFVYQPHLHFLIELNNPLISNGRAPVV